MMQNNVNTVLKPGFIGRDHHPYAFTMWMAGGGIRPGSFEATDDLGLLHHRESGECERFTGDDSASDRN